MKRIKRVCLCLAVILLASFLAIVFAGFAVKNDEEYVHKGVIRLHVVANSDLNEDQELKLKVRDAVLENLTPALKNVKNQEEGRDYIITHLKEIEGIAEKEVIKYGKDYDVKAYYGVFPFPPKKYGLLYFPAGNYEALRIVIGKGEGQNWWCVLFPPLCFVDIAKKDILDKDEILTEGKKMEITFKLKSKEVLEMALKRLKEGAKLAFKK
ncbi:MAG: stage II sporulation protein R [Thermovenabulum sp.]|uniref:stage II sporulation protein R n=1 Tax=Thermovenabulum sp. TaxID=3100335 RepID=UPI003C7E5BE0